MAHPELITNTRTAETPCLNCGAHNEPHSPACPNGERYWQVQKLGGVPMQPLKGDALVEFFR